MRTNLKGKKGFTTIDLLMSMMIVVIFASVMASVSYNTYLSSIEAKRTATALNYAVDIFEHIGILNFDEVQVSNDILNIEALSELEYTEVGTNIVKAKNGPYNITLGIEDYKNDNKIKIITLTIEYQVSRKNTEKVELQRLKIIDTV